MVMIDLKKNLDNLKKESIEDYEEYFNGVDKDKVKYVFHSVSYTINSWYTDGEDRKYISSTVRLEYEDITFAEYRAIYGLDGEFLDDYFYGV